MPDGPQRQLGPRGDLAIGAVCRVTGELFFASSVAALDAIESKYAQRGKTVEIIGLNGPSAHIHKTLGGELTAGT